MFVSQQKWGKSLASRGQTVKIITSKVVRDRYRLLQLSREGEGRVEKKGHMICNSTKREGPATSVSIMQVYYNLKTTSK